jgi:hypothetical protein
MAFGLSAAAIAAIGSTAVATYSAVDAHERGRSQANKAKDAALVQEQAFNKLNGKKPSIDGAAEANAMSAKAGPSGTLLTGAGGVDPSKLLLGRTTLLGG